MAGGEPPAKAAFGLHKQKGDAPLRFKAMKAVRRHHCIGGRTRFILRDQPEGSSKAEGHLNGVVGMEIGASGFPFEAGSIDEPKAAAFPQHNTRLRQHLHTKNLAALKLAWKDYETRKPQDGTILRLCSIRQIGPEDHGRA